MTKKNKLQNKVKEQSIARIEAFEEKLQSGEILVLVEYSYDWPNDTNISIPKNTLDEIKKCASLTKKSYFNIVIVNTLQKQEKDQKKKQIGLLASLKNVFGKKSDDTYSIEIIPHRIVEIVKVENLNNQEKEIQQNYCTIKEINNYIGNTAELYTLIRDCSALLGNLRYASLYAIKLNENMLKDINYIVQISIQMLKSIKTEDIIEILSETNLNKRFSLIKSKLAELVKEQKQEDIIKITNLNKSIEIVQDVPKGYSVVLFGLTQLEEKIILKSSEFNLWGEEQEEQAKILEKEFYQNNYKLILIKEKIEKFDINQAPTVFVGTLVNIWRVSISHPAEFKIILEKRIKKLKIVHKEGVFYGKVDEVEQNDNKSEEELCKIQDKVNELTSIYKTKITEYEEFPIFIPGLCNYEIYANNLSDLIAEEKLDTKSREEFYNIEDIVERINYLIDYLNPIVAIPQDKEQDIALKSTNIVDKITEIDTSTFTTSEEWQNLGISYTKEENPCSEKNVRLALKAYDKAIELDPTNIVALSAKASALIYYLNKYSEALEIYNNHPNVAEIMSQDQGEAYYHLRRYEEAIKCFDLAIQEKGKDENILFKKGISLMNIGNTEEAIVILDEAMELEKEVSCKNNALPVCWQILTGTIIEEDLKNIEKLVIKHPKSISAVLLKLRILDNLKYNNEALNLTNALVELNPNNVILAIFKGIILLKLNLEEADKILKEAFSRWYNYLPTKNYSKNFIIGDIANHCHNLEIYKKAIEYYNILLELEPENHFVMGWKASTLETMEKFNEALELIKQALNIDPENIENLIRQGSIYYVQKKFKEAINSYDQAIALGDNDKKEAAQWKSNALIELQKLAEESNLEYLVKNIPLSSIAKSRAVQELERIKSLSNSDTQKAHSMKYLQNILRLPWGKYENTNKDLSKATEILKQQHYGLEEVKTRILEALVFMARSPEAKPPIICLVGAPGVGKTSIANSIASVLERKCVTLSLAGARDSSLVRGFMNCYLGASPGKVLTLMSEAGTSNPVMILDEMDKIDSSRGENIEGALLQLIDPSQNSNFTDDYFDFPFDLSKVIFIITANSLDKISYPLLNRMEIIEISGYLDSEKLQIAKNYILPKILKEANLLSTEFELSEAIIRHLIKYYTHESGVRDIERLLRELVQKFLLETLLAKTPILDIALIEKYFSTPKFHSDNNKYNEVLEAGTVLGLAHTARGGDIIKVEAEKYPGTGKIKTTGKLGEVLKESIEAAYSCIKSHYEILGIKEEIFQQYDLHIHLPEGATPKDGPSAGITIFTAIASLLSNKQVVPSLAMTGELTLKGRVLAIGGLKEKLAAAVRENINTVIIPGANKRDLVKIPEEITEQLIIKTVLNVKELLNIVLKQQ